MRRTSVKVNLRWPRSTPTSTIHACFCFPPGASLLALERIAIRRIHLPLYPNPHSRARAPSVHIARGFVLWRLSDAGHRAHGTVVHSRHPKPCTKAVKLSPSRCFPLHLWKLTHRATTSGPCPLVPVGDRSDRPTNGARAGAREKKICAPVHAPPPVTPSANPPYAFSQYPAASPELRRGSFAP